MTLTRSSQIAIFWDYENCRPSNDSDGNKVIDRIQRIVQGCGSITTFRAYLDLSLNCAYSRSVTLHSDLQSSGLTLVHCPHNGKKDVADKMMIVDMLAFAIDRPAPACIVLITGDRDFAYAAAILKLRGYRIIVISPTYNSHSSLKVQAHELYDWQNDVLCSTGGTISEINPCGHKATGSVASGSQMNESLLPGATEPTVSQEQDRMESITPVGAQGGEYRSPTRDQNAFGSSPLRPEGLTQSPPHSGISYTPPPPRVDVTLTTTARADSPELSGHQANLLYANTANALLAGEVPPGGVSAGDAQSTSTTSQIQPITESQVAAPSSPVEPISFTAPSDDHETTSLLFISNTSTPSSESSLTSEPISISSYDSLSSDGSCATSDTLNLFCSQEPFRDRSTPLFAGVIEVEGSEATIASCSSTKTINSVTIETNRSHSDPSSVSTDSSKVGTVSLNPLAVPFRPAAETGRTTSPETPTTPVESAVLGPPTPTKNDRQRFQTLILFFVEWKASGQSTPISSYEVATAIRRRDPQVYVKAGVTRLKDYIEEARKAGVIISPGLDEYGAAWVEINPCLYPPTQVETTHTMKGNSSPTTPAKQATPLLTKTSQPSSPTWIYFPLTNRLRQESPSYRLLYSRLGEFFRKYHADLYQRAGVPGLAAYLEKALNMGIVRIGTEGLPGTEWAELMPAYRGTVFGG